MTTRRRRSKRRSAGKARRRRKPPIFLIDHCLGCHAVADALSAAGVPVKILRNVCAVDAPDPTWLELAGVSRWVVLSKDRYFRRRPLELAAIVAFRVRAFVLTTGGLRRDEQAAAFSTALPKILRVCAQRGPLLANVTGTGHVTVFQERQLRKWLAALEPMERSGAFDEGLRGSEKQS